MASRTLRFRSPPSSTGRGRRTCRSSWYRAPSISSIAGCIFCATSSSPIADERPLGARRTQIVRRQRSRIRRRPAGGLRRMLRHGGGRYRGADPGASRLRGACRPGGFAHQHALGRHEAAADAGARAGERSAARIHGRADHRPRPAGASPDLGAAAQADAGRQDAGADDAFHGGGRAAVPPPRHPGQRPHHRRRLAAHADRRAHRIAGRRGAWRGPRGVDGAREGDLPARRARGRHSLLLCRGRRACPAEPCRAERARIPAPPGKPGRCLSETDRARSEGLMSLRWVAVWRRNMLVWRKLMAASVLTNLADPLIMLFGLGYGLGVLLPSIEGMPYIVFFAAGSLCTATMYTASFESMFSGFSRMHGQKTWDAILYAPLVIDDIVTGEVMWAASKAWLTGSTILAVIVVFGFAASPLVLLTLPAAFLVGLAFSSVGLVMTVLARNWDFFSFYMTLVMTPMMMISGVFFPAERLPAPLLAVAQALPLYHGVALVRPMMAGNAPEQSLLHIAVLLGYAAVGYLLAIRFARKRFSE